ncbi:MAG: hypothetical protein ABID38_05790 [Candidatus Diapherotrites archaeon]
MAEDAKLKVKIELDDREFRKKVKDLKKGTTVKMGAGGSDASVKLKEKLSSGGSILDTIKNAFGGMKGAVAGGASGAAAGGAGAAGGAIAGGAVAGLAGGAVLGVLGIIASAVTTLLGLILESSGILKNSIGNLLKVIMLILRPIGDIFGSMLKPLIWVLLPMAKMINLLFKPFLLSYRKRLMEEKQKGSYDFTSENFDPFGANLRSGVGALADWGAFLFSVGLEQLLLGITSALAELARTIVNISADTLIMLLNAFKLLGNSFYDIIEAMTPFKGITDGVRGTFNNLMDSLIIGVDSMRNNSIATINKWEVDAKFLIVSAFDLMEKAFAEGLDALLTQVQAFKNALMNIPIRNGGGGPRVPATNAITPMAKIYGATGAEMDIYSKLREDAYQNMNQKADMSIPREAFAKLGFPSQQVGSSYIPETGNYMLHRGEQVLRANESKEQGVNIVQNFNVSAKIDGRLDLRKLVDEMSDLMTLNLQSELRRRVSYT